MLIPDSEKIDKNVNEIKSYFGFINTIKDVFNSALGVATGKSVKPSFSVDFSKATGKYGFSKVGKLSGINFDWYAPYKPAVDIIIVAFSYGFFIFNVYKRLPDIIAGVGAVTSK